MASMIFAGNKSDLRVSLRVNEVYRQTEAIIIGELYIGKLDVVIVPTCILITAFLCCRYCLTRQGRLEILLELQIRVADHPKILFARGIALLAVIIGTDVNPSKKNAAYVFGIDLLILVFRP